MTLLDRVKNILLHPREEWQVIEGEAATPAGLFREYVVPLAAVGPAAAAIGSLVFGYSMFSVGYVGIVLTWAIVTYLLTLAGVYVLALVIDALAPHFGGASNQIQALKVAAYGSTASFAAGILGLLPPLSTLGIVGLYSLYLFYVGAPLLMKVPAEKADGYAVGVVFAAIILFLVVHLVGGTFLETVV